MSNSSRQGIRYVRLRMASNNELDVDTDGEPSGSHILSHEEVEMTHLMADVETSKSGIDAKGNSLARQRAKAPESDHDWHQYVVPNEDVKPGSVPPPPYIMFTEKKDKPGEEHISAPQLNPEDARKALLAYVTQHCCFGSQVAREMQIINVTHTSALQYKLETFTESRHLNWDEEPYTGGPLDHPVNGLVPAPWSIPCEPTDMFKNETQEYVLPHSETLVVCNLCDGTGTNECRWCHGKGYKKCPSCNGSGKKKIVYGRYAITCKPCSGHGRVSCGVCDTTGTLICKSCDGLKKLKRFLVLAVKFKTLVSRHIVENTEFPKELVKDVGGQKVYEQTLPRVWAMTSYPNQELCKKSKDYCEGHEKKAEKEHEKIIMQRHELVVKPVWECTVLWRHENWRFWVYGNEHMVYAPKYPQRCCWRCSVM
ncbi:protein SSUH2 homolog isoform X2 [Lingula anatina]|uniref:Protein SSUH2 homolog isoform X2 n=1 Tax=Lingula anatina TaxID=7574 RepID=A0A1S3IUJ6_LINAN|nr:protein SSUH2 homolog isoform X2 [Lingula anatina]|eukprot:XP_013401209.1 protein SSUH2 homolog isoform X2 [Lingula anatina]